MTRKEKILTTLWSSLLASPLAYAAFSYTRLVCLEMDPCETGGPMPYAPLAVLILVTILVVHAGFLVMVWRSAPQDGE